MARPTGRRAGRGAGGSGRGGGGGGGAADDEGPLDPSSFKSREFLDSDDDTSSEVTLATWLLLVQGIMRLLATRTKSIPVPLCLKFNAPCVDCNS